MNLWQRMTAVFKPKPEQTRVYVPYRQAGVSVTADTALTYSAVWACVSVISRTMAMLPWGVYEKTAAGRKPVEGAVDWVLNNRPNPEMTAFSLREALMVHVLTWGNAYCEIMRDMAGRVNELWLIPPDRVTIQRSPAGSLEYRVWMDGIEKILPADRVLHIHGLGFDGVSGFSPVRMAARSMGIGMAQDVFSQAFYANGTVFGSLIEMPGNMSPTQIKQAEDAHNEKLRGPDNAFRVRVAPAGTKVHQMSMPLTDAQFLESRKFSVNEICRWYGVPPHKVGDLERSTNNNIEHQGIEFVSDAIVPWCTRLEQEVNSKLFSYRSQGRVYTKIAVNALMRGDATSRANFYRSMTQMGAMSINEVRSLEDMNGIGADGDQLLVQLNQTTLERLVEEPPEAKPTTPTAEPADDSGDDAEDPKQPTNVIRMQALEFMRKKA